GGHGHHGLVLAHVHDADTRGVAALGRDVPRRGADRLALVRDHDDLVVEGDHAGRHDRGALLADELDALDAHGPPALRRVLVQLGALAVAGLGDDEDVGVGPGHGAGDDLVALPQLHPPDPGGTAAHGPDQV